jgi:2-C-methyl-D-erythritol 4-phosphate cytidylyltransferase
MQTVAVVLAGGTGERFGTSVPKQLLPFAGRPLIEHSVAAFDGAPAVDAVLVVMAASHAGQVREALAAGGYRKLGGVIPGGPTRVESTRRAIEELGSAECDVLFHDAARPLVDQRIIADCVAALATHRAVGVAVPSSDTIAVVSDGVMADMPRRDTLVRCQTSQGFRL